MTLEEAIAEVKRLTPDDDPFTAKDFFGTGITLEGEEAVATILNAVASGQLIPLSDHKLAVAEAYRNAATLPVTIIPHSPKLKAALDALDGYRTAILALADQDALAEVQALRTERDELRDRVRTLSWMGEGYALVQARAEAAEAEVAKLREALVEAREAAHSVAHSEFDGVWSEQDFAEFTPLADAALQETKP